LSARFTPLRGLGFDSFGLLDTVTVGALYTGFSAGGQGVARIGSARFKEKFALQTISGSRFADSLRMTTAAEQMLKRLAEIDHLSRGILPVVVVAVSPATERAKPHRDCLRAG
jgi:hypothetical protein